MAAILLLAPAAAWSFASDLFGYQQAVQSDVETFPQWLSVVERHLRDDLPDGDCTEKRINRCHMARWLEFLDGVRARSPQEQLREVNRYVNSRDYVLDIENYGVEDYWAIPREHFGNGGDCEDFAIAKYFSLRWLGHAREDMRIVVVQDTNLRVPHAILAVGRDRDIVVLDNQVRDVLVQLRKRGRVVRGYIGVDLHELDADLQRSLRLGSQKPRKELAGEGRLADDPHTEPGWGFLPSKTPRVRPRTSGPGPWQDGA